MKDEKPSPLAGGKTVVAPPQPADRKPTIVSVAVAAVPVETAPMAQPVPAPAKSPALFGGHRGGGKKRADGLVAGSAEAIAADKEKERLRGVDRRAAKVLATLPPPLPGVASQAPSAAAPLVAGEPALAAPVATAPNSAPVVFPTFVAWTQKMLERPIKLFSKIADRFRVGKLMERVRKLGLGKDLEADAEKKMRYKEDQIADFNAALTNCAVVELNKRTVPGAAHSHWLELAMTGGELVSCHMDMVDWLEKEILAKAERDKPPENSAEKN